MASFYKVLKAEPLGEPWESHGNTIQSYWCEIEGEELPVSVSKKVPNKVEVGQQIYGDLLKAISKKGTDYWKFKSSQVPEGLEKPQGALIQPTQSVGGQVPGWAVPLAKMIEEIHEATVKKPINDSNFDKPITKEDLPPELF